jgi:5'-nucleotidase
VEVKTPLHHHRSVETALGNWWADRMLETHPKTDLAILNGGGLRAGFPAGTLTYGRLYETFPFDNHFVSFRLTANHLRKRLARALNFSPTLPSIAGLRINARCVTNMLEVSLFRPDGSPIPDDTSLHVLTTDYLANGGDGLFQGLTAPLEAGPPVRETVAELVGKRAQSLGPYDPQLFDPQRPRITLPRPVPVRCTFKTQLPSVEEPIGDR